MQAGWLAAGWLAGWLGGGGWCGWVGRLLGGHDVVHLLQLVGEPLLLRELVLFESDGQLLVVLNGVRVQLVQRAVRVKLGGVHLRMGSGGVWMGLVRFVNRTFWANR